MEKARDDCRDAIEAGLLSKAVNTARSGGSNLLVGKQKEQACLLTVADEPQFLAAAIARSSMQGAKLYDVAKDPCLQALDILACERQHGIAN